LHSDPIRTLGGYLVIVANVSSRGAKVYETRVHIEYQRIEKSQIEFGIFVIILKNLENRELFNSAIKSDILERERGRGERERERYHGCFLSAIEMFKKNFFVNSGNYKYCSCECFILCN